MKKSGWKKICAQVLSVTLAGIGVMGYRLTQKTAPVFAPVRVPERQLILDAGHGGEDGGAVSLSGVPESGVNLAVTLKLDQLLGFYGVPTHLLRDKDVSLHNPEADTLRKKKVSDLHNRVAAIGEVENSVVISVHQNTFPSPVYHGAQVFYRPESRSQALAVLVQDSLRSADPENKRVPAKIPDTVYLMKHITCPAVLVECGFLSNPTEEGKLLDSGYQTKLAACLASAWLRSGEIYGGALPEGVV